MNITGHEYLKSINFELFLYMSESYKRKHQWKIRNTGREERKHTHEVPTLINTTSCREVKGREIIRERDQERNIRSMQTGGDISTGGVILFPMMSKGEKEKDQKRKIQAHEVREGLFRKGILSGESLFVIDIKKKEEHGKKHEDKNM
jgi:hypothetical protein